MEPRISMITLGVSDLGRSVSFYQDILGLPLSKHSVEGAVAFFELNGTWLALFRRDELAKDARVQNDGGGFDGIALAHNLKSEEEVKHFFELLKSKGVLIAKEPVKADWGGFSGYFKDPDGHLWEVAYNPAFWIGPRSET
ncbi:MAG TPA: VOC family protein [Terriglobia bacterium]|nr:VOC family protein [Terriglobia bacterium]